MDYKEKYIKYKTKYLELKDIDVNNQIGGAKNKNPLIKKIKMVEYVDKNIYYLNTVDNDKLDGFSEFLIGSVTKLFTILSLLILHKNNKINIYDDIGKYIDNNEIKNLKIIDIINHTSGLKNLWDGANYGSSKIKYNTATQIYNKWNNDKLIDANMSGKYFYSNIGYAILGVLIEKVSNTIYSDFIKQNILIPLKMNNTGIEDCNITLYNHKQKKLSKYEKCERTFASSAGELKSCINDLIKFSKFPTLLNNDTLKIIKEFNIFLENNEIYRIKQGGEITGGSAKFSLAYNKKWQIKDIYISLETIKN
jgi:CubicO group peptidase (beta-lactamase class C family)